MMEGDGRRWKLHLLQRDSKVIAQRPDAISPGDVVKRQLWRLSARCLLLLQPLPVAHLPDADRATAIVKESRHAWLQ